MTELLTKAFEEVSKLPQNLQNEVAKQLLEDIKGELTWDKTLSKSQTKLGEMADKALQQFKTGKTKKAGFDIL